MDLGIPYIVSRGTPYEIGFHHGKAASNLIKKSIDLMLLLSQKNSGLSKEESLNLSRQFIPIVEKYNPDYLEEIKGIAEGATIPFDEIMFLNCRTEILKAGNNRNPKGEIDISDTGCTSFSVTGEITENGHTYTGQSWDNIKACQSTLIAHLIIQNSPKPSIFYVGEAGIISRMGINSAGIGGGVNSLSTNGPVNFKGVPLQFVLRGVMDSTNLADAITAITRMPNGAVNNIMIGYKDNEAVDVEIDHDNCECLYPIDSIITHTNHYVHPNRPHYPYYCKYTGSSIVRKGRSDKLLRLAMKTKGIISKEDIIRMYMDHGNYPYSICVHCAHPQEDTELQNHTNCAFICDLNDLTIDVAIGNPCESGFITLRPFDCL